MSWEDLTTVLQPLNIVYAMLTVALFFAFIRLARGPSLPDRVVALDLITVITVGFIAAYAIDVGQRVFLDAAIVVALIAFLGTVAFARYVERGERHD
jgi:multicomponent Na+:H+ antiporter subunit F